MDYMIELSKLTASESDPAYNPTDSNVKRSQLAWDLMKMTSMELVVMIQEKVMIDAFISYTEIQSDIGNKKTCNDILVDVRVNSKVEDIKDYLVKTQQMFINKAVVDADKEKQSWEESWERKADLWALRAELAFDIKHLSYDLTDEIGALDGLYAEANRLCDVVRNDLTGLYYLSIYMLHARVVRDAHCRVLKRSPENHEVAEWDSWLQVYPNSVKGMIQILMLTEEFQTNFVNGKTEMEVSPLFYDVPLARKPESTDAITHWADYFGEYGLEAVIIAFMGSSEYRGKFGYYTVPGGGRLPCNL